MAEVHLSNAVEIISIFHTTSQDGKISVARGPKQNQRGLAKKISEIFCRICTFLYKIFETKNTTKKYNDFEPRPGPDLWPAIFKKVKKKCYVNFN